MFTTKLKTFVKFQNLRFCSSQTESIGLVSYKKIPDSQGRIALYGLNSSTSKNTLSHEFIKNMREVNEILRNDTKVSVVVLHSLVPGVFCAGANLKERMKMNDVEVKNFVHHLRETFTEIEDLPMPTIAAIDGFALGGGLELALACDIRIVSDNSKIGLVETSRGILPGAGGTQRLPRAIQPNIAKELIFTSRILSGLESQQIGISNHCVPQNIAKNAAFQKAIDIAKEIAVNAPVAVRCAKQAVNEGLQLSIKQGCDVEQKWYEVNIPTKDRQEGMISFVEKRKPVYQGH